jgi:Arc/MetJ-type ribon-helix-helix transcriptional regulator
MNGMKLSVSLPDDDVAYLDQYARTRGTRSRSAALHAAVGALRATELGDAYEDAWRTWASGGEAQAWDATTSDGIAS